MFAPTPVTPAGERLMALAGTLADDLATRAAEHDRDGSFPHASVAALRAAGYFAAPIPAALGGLGVASVHDLVLASARLARGDASVAIGVNMHLTILGNLVRRHAVTSAAGDERRAASLGAALAALAAGGDVIASAASERGQDLTRPQTTAVPAGDGWRIDGRKVFCTMVPAATLLYVAVTAGDRYAWAQVPAGTPGVVVHDDWDALGMRASGSHSVSFEGVELPRGAVTRGFAAGDAVPYMAANLTAGLFHAAASLGVAEASAARVTHARDARATVQIGENAVDLSAARASLARGGALVDAAYAGHPAAALPADTIVGLFGEVQAVKTFVNEASVRIVDRALACSGGAGYASGNPLSRAYRDVRAGAFMHPLGANRAYEFLSALALGATPALH